MPVVIRELIIKATVDENNSAASSNPANSGASMRQVQQQEDFVALCVEQVMEILERSKER